VKVASRPLIKVKLFINHKDNTLGVN